jgi:hypothetical protein
MAFFLQPILVSRARQSSAGIHLGREDLYKVEAPKPKKRAKKKGAEEEGEELEFNDGD